MKRIVPLIPLILFTTIPVSAKQKNEPAEKLCLVPGTRFTSSPPVSLFSEQFEIKPFDHTLSGGKRFTQRILLSHGELSRPGGGITAGCPLSNNYLRELSCALNADQIQVKPWYNDRSCSGRTMNPRSIYQFTAGLGSYGSVTKNVQDLLNSNKYSDTIFTPENTAMRYKPKVMQGIGGLWQERGDRFIFLYGKREPWSTSKISISPPRNALKWIL